MIWLLFLQDRLPLEVSSQERSVQGVVHLADEASIAHLVTAFANPIATSGPVTEQLLECAISALEERPVLTIGSSAIQVVYDSVSLSALTALWLAAKAEFQLSAAYVARGVTIAGSQP